MAGSEQKKESEKGERLSKKMVRVAKKDRRDGKAQNKAEEKGMEESPVEEEMRVGQPVEKSDNVQIRKNRAGDRQDPEMPGGA
jgi:hypothetical protein